MKQMTTASTSSIATKLLSRRLPEDQQSSFALGSNACSPAVKSIFRIADGSYFSTGFAPTNAFVPSVCWFNELASENY
jgi:hypothetical protein